MPRKRKTSIIGQTLKDERRLLGLTQVQAANQFKVSLKALRNLEQGYESITLSTASRILEYLGKQIRIGDITSSPVNRNLKRPRRQKVLDTLLLVKPVLEKKFDVELIALFGSTSRDKAKKNSDIDLAVRFKKRPTLSSIGRMTVFLESILEGHKIDLVEFDRMISEVAATAKSDFIYV